MFIASPDFLTTELTVMIQGTKDVSTSSVPTEFIVLKNINMEHENMDNEDYLMHSGLLDDDDTAE